MLAISKLDMSKGISKVSQWDNEHLFYNKYFYAKDANEVLNVTKYFEDRNMVIFGHFFGRESQQFDPKAVSI